MFYLYFIPVFIYTFIKVKSKYGKKRDGCAMAKWLQTFFLLAAKLYMLLVLLRPSKIPLQPDAISPQLEPENIRESILDFTARFGEINPDMPYLCRREQSGLKRTVFAFFPLFGGSR